MLGIQDGWEVLNLKNAGIDRVVGPTKQDWLLYRVQISITMAPSASAPTQTGLAQVLCNGWITEDTPTFGPQQAPFLAPTNTDWGPGAFINPNNFAAEAQQPAGGNNGADMCFPLFAKIMKAQLANPDQYDFDTGWIPNGLTVWQGSCLILHADHTNWPNDMNNQADLEWQYTLWYDVTS